MVFEDWLETSSERKEEVKEKDIFQQVRGCGVGSSCQRHKKTKEEELNWGE